MPPYRLLALTTWSPAPAMLRMLKVTAAEPELKARAPTPPSSAATRFSKTSLVGFMIRV